MGYQCAFTLIGLIGIVLHQQSVCAGGIRITSDDGAVVLLLRSGAVEIERDEHDNLTGVIPRLCSLHIYNSAMSSDGSYMVFHDMRERLHFLRKVDCEGRKRWTHKATHFPLEIESCTRLALTNDDESEKLMRLRFARDGQRRLPIITPVCKAVLILLKKEMRYPYDASCGSVTHRVVATDMQTGELVSFENCDAITASRGRHDGGPVLSELMTPDEVVSRLGKIMPLGSQHILERSACLYEPPQNIYR